MTTASRFSVKNRLILKWGLALLVILLCLLSFLADDTVAAFFASIASLHSRFFESVVKFLNRHGDWSTLAPLGLVTAWIAWTAQRKAVARLLLVMVFASTVAGIAVNTFRWTTGRPRPHEEVQDGFYGFKKDGKWIVAKSQFQSFPSAHTATATAFVGVLLFSGIRYGWVFVLFGPIVGCARIYSRAHHFSDVVTATLIGLLVAHWACRYAKQKWGLKSAVVSETAPGQEMKGVDTLPSA